MGTLSAALQPKRGQSGKSAAEMPFCKVFNETTRLHQCLKAFDHTMHCRTCTDPLHQPYIPAKWTVPCPFLNRTRVTLTSDHKESVQAVSAESMATRRPQGITDDFLTHWAATRVWNGDSGAFICRSIGRGSCISFALQLLPLVIPHGAWVNPVLDKRGAMPLQH